MAKGSNRVVVAGVGMIPFSKPGKSADYDVMGAEAINMALADSGLHYSDVQQAHAGWVFGASTSGQKAIYRVGMSGIPVTNVNNNCSTGSTALYLAREAVEYGIVDCALAVGFEQMVPGAIDASMPDLQGPSPFAEFDRVCDELVGHTEVPLALRYFGGAGLEHQKRYGSTNEDLAKIRAKASQHANQNPLAVFRDVVTPEQVLHSLEFWPGVMTKLMACPPTSGAAAAIVCSEEFAKKKGLKIDAVIAGQVMVTDTPDTFEERNMMKLAGYGMTERGSRQLYEQAGIGPDDVDVVEMHDCFAQAELITYEGLGLCGEGEASKMIADGDNTYGGKYVVNPSGGLLSKGHPLGATGLAQCYELTRQVRGTAGPTQVEGARTALQHNLGLGGAGVMTLYQSA